MAIRYYDDIIYEKIKRWVPEQWHMRVLKPDETKRLFEITADDSNDQQISLPLVTLSRNDDIELLSTIKQSRSFDGLHLLNNTECTVQLNVIPIEVMYQLDIYTKKYDEGDNFIRAFLFKLINNPKLVIEVPYEDVKFQHVAYISILSTVSDTSNINERLFSGQFTRWSIQFRLQDAFLFDIRYRNNWKFVLDEMAIELSAGIENPGDIEEVTFPEVIYTWADDYSTCTAKVVLNNNTGEAFEETVATVYVHDSTDDHMINYQEHGHYEAHFTNTRFDNQKTEPMLKRPIQT